MTTVVTVGLDSAMSLVAEHKLKPGQAAPQASLAGPLVWSGADFKYASSYTLQLDDDDVLEVDNALAEFKSKNPLSSLKTSSGPFSVSGTPSSFCTPSPVPRHQKPVLKCWWLTDDTRRAWTRP